MFLLIDNLRLWAVIILFLSGFKHRPMIQTTWRYFVFFLLPHTRRGLVVPVFQDTPKASPCKERSDSVADIPIQVKRVAWFMHSGRENRERCSYSHPTFFAGHWSWGPIAYPWTSFNRFVLQFKVITDHARLFILKGERGWGHDFKMKWSGKLFSFGSWSRFTCLIFSETGSHTGKKAKKKKKKSKKVEVASSDSEEVGILMFW